MVAPTQNRSLSLFTFILSSDKHTLRIYPRPASSQNWSAKDGLMNKETVSWLHGVSVLANASNPTRQSRTGWPMYTCKAQEGSEAPSAVFIPRVLTYSTLGLSVLSDSCQISSSCSFMVLGLSAFGSGELFWTRFRRTEGLTGKTPAVMGGISARFCSSFVSHVDRHPSLGINSTSAQRRGDKREQASTVSSLKEWTVTLWCGGQRGRRKQFVAASATESSFSQENGIWPLASLFSFPMTEVYLHTQG